MRKVHRKTFRYSQWFSISASRSKFQAPIEQRNQSFSANTSFNFKSFQNTFYILSSTKTLNLTNVMLEYRAQRKTRSRMQCICYGIAVAIYVVLMMHSKFYFYTFDDPSNGLKVLAFILTARAHSAQCVCGNSSQAN